MGAPQSSCYDPSQSTFEQAQISLFAVGIRADSSTGDVRAGRVYSSTRQQHFLRKEEIVYSNAKGEKARIAPHYGKWIHVRTRRYAVCGEKEQESLFQDTAQYLPLHGDMSMGTRKQVQQHQRNWCRIRKDTMSVVGKRNWTPCQIMYEFMDSKEISVKSIPLIVELY